jgi:hypothetical protein
MSREPLEFITLTSPSGTVHQAKWRGNKKTVKKKVGVFEYPDVDGSTTQDLGLASQPYPLTLFFDGVDHVILAKNFEDSLAERGPWEVIHPVLGLLKLQPLSADFNHMPVQSKIVTKVDSTWIKKLPEYQGASFSQMAADVKSDGLALASEIAVLLPDEPYDDEEGKRSFIQYCKDIVAGYRAVLASFYDINNLVRNEIAEKLTAIDDMLAQPFFVATTVISAINTVYRAPANLRIQVIAKMRMYELLTNDANTAIESRIESNIATTSVARTNDQLQSGLAGALAISTTIGGVLSREEALEIAASLKSQYQSMVAINDAQAEVLQFNLSKDTYYSNIAGFEQIRNLMGRAIGFVIDENYSQQVRKTVLIPSPTATLDYAIESYPDMTSEEAYDFFIETNNLADDDIIFLPTSKEVVVYV